MVKIYLVTIKNNSSKFVSIQDLLSQYNRAKNMYHAEWSDQLGFEPDSLGRMHFHGLAYFKNTISMKKHVAMFKHGSWIIHFQPVKRETIERVSRYIVKNKTPCISEEYSYQHDIMRRAKKLRIL